VPGLQLLGPLLGACAVAEVARLEGWWVFGCGLHQVDDSCGGSPTNLARPEPGRDTRAARRLCTDTLCWGCFCRTVVVLYRCSSKWWLVEMVSARLLVGLVVAGVARIVVAR